MTTRPITQPLLSLANDGFGAAGLCVIGVGTATPQGFVHLLTNASQDLILESTSGGDQFWLNNDSLNDLEFDSETTDNIMVLNSADGNVGLGASAPAKQLHVQGADADPLGANNVMTRIENTSGTTESRRMLELVNNGSPLLVYQDTDSGDTWALNPVGSKFVIGLSGTGQQEIQVQSDGDLVVAGTVSEGSSRAVKTAIDAVDPSAVLAKLAELPLTEWSYKKGDMTRHLGPMAEDFYRIFGLGPDAEHIAPKDLAGVAMASAKALREKVQAQQDELAAKEKKIEKLETRMERLEAAVLND